MWEVGRGNVQTLYTVCERVVVSLDARGGGLEGEGFYLDL